MPDSAEKKTESSGRMANFELLRIISMFMVIMLHYISRTGSLAGTELEMTGVRMAGGFLESFCIVAVNVYVLISGYFLCRSSFKVSRLLELLAQVLFYSLLIPVILRVFGASAGGAGAWEASKYFFPVSTEHYWFATAYVYMYLLSPLTGIAVRHFSQQQHRLVLGLLLFFFCILKSISPVQFVMDRAGYDVLWFLCLYLTGAYMRLYGADVSIRNDRTQGAAAAGMDPGSMIRDGRAQREGRRRASAVYCVSCLLIFVLYAALHAVYERTGRLAYFAGVPFHYNFILCFTGAAGLFVLFAKIRIHEGRPAQWIRGIAPYTFGVYLIHEHLDVRSAWPGWMASLTGGTFSGNPAGFIGQAVIRCALLYMICMCIDWLRGRIFAAVKRQLRTTKAAEYIANADAAFRK